MAHLGDLFRSGDRVQHSGIYRVVHSPEHEVPHEVTCLYGKRFPPCRCCEHARFVLVRGAESVDTHVHFQTAPLAFHHARLAPRPMRA
jgi:hypothetical protein